MQSKLAWPSKQLQWKCVVETLAMAQATASILGEVQQRTNWKEWDILLFNKYKTRYKALDSYLRFILLFDESY